MAPAGVLVGVAAVLAVRRVRRALPAPLVVPGQPPPAAPLRVVELRQLMEPAALLAEALTEASDEDDGLLGVRLAHLVPPVVPPSLAEVDAAPLHLAPRPAAAARRGATAGKARRLTFY